LDSKTGGTENVLIGKEDYRGIQWRKGRIELSKIIEEKRHYRRFLEEKQRRKREVEEKELRNIKKEAEINSIHLLEIYKQEKKERSANGGGDRFKSIESTFQKFTRRSRTGRRKEETKKGG